MARDGGISRKTATATAGGFDGHDEAVACDLVREAEASGFIGVAATLALLSPAFKAVLDDAERDARA